MKLKRELKLRKVGSHYMIVDSLGKQIDLATVYTLNGVAACLWQKASEGDFSVASLTEWLCGEYEVETGLAEEDVKAMLNQWREYGLIDE